MGTYHRNAKKAFSEERTDGNERVSGKKSSKILDELQTTEQGLSEAEAARRLSEHGPNRLAAGKKKSNLQRFFEELKDPMILILLAAALISGITSAYEGRIVR